MRKKVLNVLTTTLNSRWKLQISKRKEKRGFMNKFLNAHSGWFKGTEWPAFLKKNY